jgi:RHS repeat-associated protein
VKYYYAGAQRVAMRQGSTLYYLLPDHLGSTSLTSDANGAKLAELRYRAWGETRYNGGSTPTRYQYTGQYSYTAEFGLYFYNARWYDPALGRFTQPDTLVPEPGNPQALNRYAYVYNNPLRYTDPTGHYISLEDDFGVRITRTGVVQVVRGGSHFANRVELAIANAILSGETRHLAAIPADAPPWAIQRSLARVASELGYGGFGVGVGDLLLDPVLAAGVGMAIGKGVENTVGAVSASWLDLVPPRYRASVAQAFKGTPEVITLSEDLIVYRHWGGEAAETGSPWFSPKPYVRSGNARRYLALPNTNTAENISVFKIPAGTTIIRGEVAPRVRDYGPHAVGGGMQIYLPDPEKALLLGPLDVVGR